MIKNLLQISLIQFMCSTLIFGQHSQSIIPPSPNTKEFTKYIDQRVSLYNGIPEINIPLYNIQLKGLTIPVSLSYHASGIKYGQVDGDVGVGWVLNPGYRISRSVRGHADEKQSMPADVLTTMNNLESNGVAFEREGYLSKFIPDIQFNLDFGSAYQGSLDGEFDQFTFSTPNTAGKFIITDRVNKIGSTLEESNLQIDYKLGLSQCSQLNNYAITGLKIIDEVGNKFFYGDYNSQTVCHIETASPQYGPFVATGWGLAEIVTPTGDSVKFNYERRPAWSGRTDHMRNFTMTETTQENCFINTTPPQEGGDMYFDPGYNTFYSKEIITPNEKIIFHYNGDPPYALYPKKLNDVQVKDTKGNVLRIIEFFYTEIFSQTTRHIFLDHVTIYDGSHNEVETYRFDYHDKDINAVFTADQYGYYLEDNGSSVPRFYHQEFLDDPILINSITGTNCSVSLGSTMVSYLSGMTLPSRKPVHVPDYFALKKITYPTGGYSEYEYEHGQYGVEGHVENAGIRIKKITSSDGANPEVLVRNYAYGNNQNGHIENGIGKYKVWVTPDLFVKEKAVWTYGCFLNPEGSPDNCNYWMHRMVTYSSTMQGDLADALSQSNVVYPCVTEYNSKYVPSNGYPISEKSGGKTVYYYNTGDIFDVHVLPKLSQIPGEQYAGRTYVDAYRLWDTPRLERQVVFSLQGTQYVPLNETIFNYYQISRSFTGLKVIQSVIHHNENTASVAGSVYTLPDRFFDYGGYTIEIGKNMLMNKIEHKYLNGNTFTTTYSYDYSNLLPAKETMTRSTGGTVVTHTSYPKDYASGTGFIDQMVTNNLIAYPIEQIKYLDDGTNKKILSGQIIKYKTGGKGLKDSELSLETVSSISLGNFKFSNRIAGQLPPSGTPTTFTADNNYKSRLTYDFYDLNGNLLSATNDGDLSTSYLWGYNKTYPVAKIENARYNASGIDNSSGTPVYTRINEVLHENFEEHPQKLASNTSHTGKYVYQGNYDVELRDKIVGDYLLTYWSSNDGLSWKMNQLSVTVNSFSTVYTIGNSSIYLDDIRFHPIDAQMSTYTYNPLIGMSSQTNPGGLTTYYVYDSFGRLILVKDYEGNILKQYEYEYQER